MTDSLSEADTDASVSLTDRVVTCGMPMTGAERQRAFRQRQIDRLAELETAAAEHDRIIEDLAGRLEAALAENERLAMARKHPPGVIDSGRCHA